MLKAGVPCVPGYQGRGPEATPVMLKEAKKIGFPVMIKAVAGGGGARYAAGRGRQGISGRAAQRRGPRRRGAFRRSHRDFGARPLSIPGTLKCRCSATATGKRHPSRRARLLGAAPAPEADRGSGRLRR